MAEEYRVTASALAEANQLSAGGGYRQCRGTGGAGSTVGRALGQNADVYRAAWRYAGDYCGPVWRFPEPVAELECDSRRRSGGAGPSAARSGASASERAKPASAGDDQAKKQRQVAG